jgi:hypothetical protein
VTTITQVVEHGRDCQTIGQPNGQSYTPSPGPSP